jgi:hypothetical protein
VPYSAGGEATAQNIQLRCRAHNGYEAAQYLGTRTAPREPAMVRERRAVYLPAGARPYQSFRRGPARTRFGPSSRPDGEPP